MVFAIAETLATVTKGRVPSVLVIMMLMLIRFLQSKFIKTHPGPELSPFKKLLSKIMISRQSATVDRDVAMLNSCEHFSKQKELR